MNTCAGYALNQRKPRPAPAIAVQKIASSPMPAMYGMLRYVANFALPLAYAKIASAEATSTVGMIAKPSRPSVRLTALLLPTMTRYAHGMKKMPSDNDTCLTNGTISVVSTDVAALQYITVPTLKPNRPRQKHFQIRKASWRERVLQCVKVP